MQTEYPITDVTVPKEGYTAMSDRYWLVRNGNVIGFNATRGDMGSPQCNPSIAVANIIKGRTKYFSDCEVVFIPVVYWKRND